MPGINYQDELSNRLDAQAEKIINTLPIFAAKFFDFIMLEKGFSSRTTLQYAYDLRMFFDYIQASAGFKDTNIRTLTASDIFDKLTHEDIQEYLKTISYYEKTDPKTNKAYKVKASNATRARRISSLRSFMNYYFKEKDISNNLASLMELPKMKDKDIVVLDKDEIQRLLSAVIDIDGLTPGQLKRHEKIIDRDRAILMVLLGTGIRVSELVGINCDDIDFIGHTIRVVRKGGDVDYVPVGSSVLGALDEYRNGARNILLLPDVEKDAFFLSMQHKRLSVASVEKLVEAYARKANINKPITPHSCRKSFGTMLYEKYGDIYLVAESLHHSSVETTRKHYAKMSSAHKSKIADAAEEMLNE